MFLAKTASKRLLIKVSVLITGLSFAFPSFAQYGAPCNYGEKAIQRNAIVVGARASGGCWVNPCNDDIQKEQYNAPDGWVIENYETRMIDSNTARLTTSSVSMIRGGQDYNSNNDNSFSGSTSVSGNVNNGFDNIGGSYNSSSSGQNSQRYQTSSLVTGITLKVIARAEARFGGGPGSARQEAVDVLLKCIAR